MEYLWLAISCISIALLNLILFVFIIKNFHLAQKNRFFLFGFSLGIGLASFLVYILSGTYTALTLIILFVFLLQTFFFTGGPVRLPLFIASGVLLNITIVHTLVLTIFSIVSSRSIQAVYQDTSVFPITILITHLFFLVVFLIFRNRVQLEKIVKLAKTKYYSEIMSGVSLFFLLVLCFDTWLIDERLLSHPFALSTISTILFVLALFYCLLHFNVSLVQLHPYKRKADEAKTLHEIVVRKKLETEFKLYSDDLTKLYNRRFIFSKLDELCEVDTAKFGLCFLDLASLKYVNDTFGHKEGDQYIIDIANILKASIRDEDLSARIGGDEFILVLLDVTESELDVVVGRIQNKVAHFNESKPYIFHANMGYMCFDMADKKHSRVEMLGYVDELMNIDKERFYGRGGV